MNRSARTERTVADNSPPAFRVISPVDAYRSQILALARNARHTDIEAVARKWLQLEPANSDAWNELAVSVWKQGRLAEAESSFQHALQIDAHNEAVWTNFGHMLSTMGRHAAAIQAYHAAIKQVPESFDAIMGIGVALSNLWKPQEAVPYLAEALRLRPQSPQALLNFGMNLGRMRRWHDAIACYEEALRHGCDLPVLHRNLGVAYLMVGDYEKGWPEYEWRRTFNSTLGVRVNRTFWNGDDFRNQTILLHFEQGLGDTLQFIRYAPLVKRRGGRVVVLCPAVLHSLLARCDGVDQLYDGSGPAPECHIQAPLMSLPSILGTTLETIPAEIPYLHPDPAIVALWRTRLNDALAAESSGHEQRPFLVGIVWQGRAENATDHIRSFPLAQFERIAKVPGVRLVNLQVGSGLEQVSGLGDRFPILDLPGRAGRDFAETASIMRLLDLVITPDTAAAHLAGGLGVRTWVALSAVGEWRWMLDREDSPWYPTLRLFRQTTLGVWDDVFARMATALRGELECGSH